MAAIKTPATASIATALPAGTANIGDVDIASALPAGTNNIGDVDVLTLPALPAGENLIGHVGAPVSWAQAHEPAAATQATTSKAATADGSRHVCTGLVVSLGTDDTAQTPLAWQLRDGATGAGTVLAAGTLSAPANGGEAHVALTGLYIPGTPDTAMTLETAAAPVANAKAVVTLIGVTEAP